MKRVGKVFLIAVMVFVTGGYFVSRWFFNQGCEPPNKPKNVPINAHWFGGCDGGDWIELISIQEGKYRFKIYRDWDGILKLDGEFEKKGCDKLELSASNFTEIISYYNVGLDNKIRLEVRFDSSAKNEDCHLELIFPAYGGEEWELIKEKGEYVSGEPDA